MASRPQRKSSPLSRNALRKHVASPKVEHEIGSNNVFADLGLPDAEELLFKAKLSHLLEERLSELGLNQAQAAKRLGISQPKVSALVNGHTRGFSSEKLMQLLVSLGNDVEVRVSRSKHERGTFQLFA